MLCLIAVSLIGKLFVSSCKVHARRWMAVSPMIDWICAREEECKKITMVIDGGKRTGIKN